MAIFDYQKKEIQLKIVYYGPGLSGKTSNLQFIYDHTRAENKGKLVSLATQTDRTLFFDFLPLELGSLGGYKMRFLLYTVPGQVHYDATRKLVLKGVDGIVFVADSQREMKEANIQSFVNMEKNLLSYNKKLKDLPVVLQANKRDLPDVLGMEELNLLLNRYRFPAVEASATTGTGVLETLRLITRLVIRSIQDRVGAEVEEPPSPRPEAGASAAKAAPVMPPPSSRPAPPPASARPAPPLPAAKPAPPSTSKPSPSASRPVLPPPAARPETRPEPASKPLLVDGVEREQTVLFRFPVQEMGPGVEIELAMKVRLKVEEGRLVGEVEPAPRAEEPTRKAPEPASAQESPLDEGGPAPSKVWEPPASNLPPLVTLGDKESGGGSPLNLGQPPPLGEMTLKGPDRPDLSIPDLPPLGEEPGVSFGGSRGMGSRPSPAGPAAPAPEEPGTFRPPEETLPDFNTSPEELEFTDNALDQDAAEKQKDLSGGRRGGLFAGFRKKR